MIDSAISVEKTKNVLAGKGKRSHRCENMTLAEFIDSQCRDRKSTLAYFKRIGLTWDKEGNPVVVPR